MLPVFSSPTLYKHKGFQMLLFLKLVQETQILSLEVVFWLQFLWLHVGNNTPTVVEVWKDAQYS